MPADLTGVVVPAGVCRVIQSHGSARNTAGGHSLLWLMGPPGSGRIWRDLGGATR